MLPSVKLDLASVSATTDFIKTTSKADILQDNSMSSEAENKPIIQILTPLVSYKTNNRSKNDIVSFKIKLIPHLSTCAQYSKSAKKLINLSGEAPFVKFFDIARKKKTTKT